MIVEPNPKTELIARYPWLGTKNSVEDYVPPGYYNALLKEYRFDGRADLEFLGDAIDGSTLDGSSSILEFGCGTGRATQFLLSRTAWSEMHLVDLSLPMIRFVRSRFSGKRGLEYYNQDSLAFVDGCANTFTFVFSLWSFSHSVFHSLVRLGLDDGAKRVKATLTHLLRNCVRPGGTFFLIHFDSQSEEQTILMQQWKRIYPFLDLSRQSPSKLILDDTFSSLVADGTLVGESRHLVGDPIHYQSEDEALETFMNFHLETYFNATQHESNVLHEIKDYLQAFSDGFGGLALRPGAFVYTYRRSDSLRH